MQCESPSWFADGFMKRTLPNEKHVLENVQRVSVYPTTQSAQSRKGLALNKIPMRRERTTKSVTRDPSLESDMADQAGAGARSPHNAKNQQMNSSSSFFSVLVLAGIWVVELKTNYNLRLTQSPLSLSLSPCLCRGTRGAGVGGTMSLDVSLASKRLREVFAHWKVRALACGEIIFLVVSTRFHLISFIPRTFTLWKASRQMR